MTIIERIEQQFEHLSPGQKNVAHYIQTHVRDVALLSAQKIAAQAGVSEATVHRLALALSYSGYSGMRKDLQAYVLKAAHVVPSQTRPATHEEEPWLKQHFEQEMDNLRQTSGWTSAAQIDTAARMMLEADRIWVAGWRLGLSVTASLAYTLRYLLGNCELIPQGGVAEYAAYMKPGDVLFASGFPRYCPRTLKVIRMAREQGATVIVLTDTSLSPFVKLADLVLLAKSKSGGILDSYVAPLAITNAIVQQISTLDEERIQQNISKMDIALRTFRDQFDWSDQ
ncbi:HTH-type transcriptional regulator RpiR [compost metagenome]